MVPPEIKTMEAFGMQHTHTRAALIRLVQAALIAALYTVYTVLIQPAGFGAVQFRVSEAFTILPVFTPAAIPGLAIGCLVSNLFGLMGGANPAGPGICFLELSPPWLPPA